jgi:pimeloyl-ACP methyl ester carboxylesterase
LSLVADNAPAWVAGALQHSATSHHVSVDGCAIHYLSWNADERDKPGLLLVHGFCAHAHWWDFVAPALLDQYRVFAIDLGGMGDSGHRQNYRINTYSREIAAVIDAAGIAPATVVAHSFGGLMTIQAAYRYPEKLRAAVIVDSRISFPKTGGDTTPASRGASEQRPKRIYPDFDQALARFRLIPQEHCADAAVFEHVGRLSLRPESEGWVWKFDDRITFTLDHTEISEAEMLRKISVPMAFIYGEHSVVAPKDIADKTVAYMSQARPALCVTKAYHHVLLDNPLALRAMLLELIPELHAAG